MFASSLVISIQKGLRNPVLSARFSVMKDKKRGFDGTNFKKRGSETLADEAAVVRAVEAFTHATRRAGDRAHAAGVSIRGRIAGKRVTISSDGKVTEVLDSK